MLCFPKSQSTKAGLWGAEDGGWVKHNRSTYFSLLISTLQYQVSLLPRSCKSGGGETHNFKLIICIVAL